MPIKQLRRLVLFHLRSVLYNLLNNLLLRHHVIGLIIKSTLIMLLVHDVLLVEADRVLVLVMVVGLRVKQGGSAAHCWRFNADCAHCS